MHSFHNPRNSRTQFPNAPLILVSMCAISIIITLPAVQSSALSSRHRKSLTASSADESVQSFECTDANTYLYHVLSQSKTARSLNSESVVERSSNQHPTIPRKAINGDHLKVCAQGFTCCTEEMESRLLAESKREFQKSVQDKIVGLSHTFESRTSKFDRFFRELLSNARRDLHNMFLRTYGLLYEQNSDIFAALFDNLTQYYGNGASTSAMGGNLQASSVDSTRVNLSTAIDSFYNTLYQRMFRILNQPHDFEPRYWQCMSGQMERLKPFGDVPSNMKQQVKKAFIAARTFVLALATGRDVVRKMMEVSPSNECTSSLTRMLYCHHCRGLSNIKPCSNFCFNVMKGCLAYQDNFDHNWDEYLDALLQLLTRLEGPFNIESVIDPIDVKISEAIMIFQDRGKEISDQIFSECGSPKTAVGHRQRRGRHRRDSNQEDTRPSSSRRRPQSQRGRGRQRQQKQQQQNPGDSLTLGTSGQPFGAAASNVRPTTAAGTSLDRLARDLREKVQPAKGFWRHLPNTLCNGENPSVANADASNTDCWNGMAKGRSESPSTADGLPTIPEAGGESSRPSVSPVNELLDKLQAATTAMKKALQGQEPNWPHLQASTGQVASQHSNSSLKKETGKQVAPSPRSEARRPDLADSPADSSGDITDDTEMDRPRTNANAENTDDEDLTGGSGSGDDEIAPPPTLSIYKPAAQSTTKRPLLHPQPEEGDIVEVDEGERRKETTTAGWASSEEGGENTFEPVTLPPDAGEGDDESDEEDDYDENWDDDKDWKEDDYGAATTTALRTTSTMDHSHSETSTLSTAVFFKESFSSTSRWPILTEPPARTESASTTRRAHVTRRPSTPSGGSALRCSFSTWYFLLAFYAALMLLWKRL